MTEQQPLADLRALAEAATPGPWIHGEETEHWSRTYRVPIGPGLIAGATKPADAAYIAAVDPQTVLALLDSLDALREQLAAARAALQRFRDHFAERRSPNIWCEVHSAAHLLAYEDRCENCCSDPPPPADEVQSQP